MKRSLVSRIIVRLMWLQLQLRHFQVQKTQAALKPPLTLFAMNGLITLTLKLITALINQQLMRAENSSASAQLTALETSFKRLMPLLNSPPTIGLPLSQLAKMDLYRYSSDGIYVPRVIKAGTL